LKIPKDKKVGSVPMVPEVADCLARLKDREHFTDDDDLVFPKRPGTISTTGRSGSAITPR